MINTLSPIDWLEMSRIKMVLKAKMEGDLLNGYSLIDHKNYLRFQYLNLKDRSEESVLKLANSNSFNDIETFMNVISNIRVRKPLDEPNFEHKTISGLIIEFIEELVPCKWCHNTSAQRLIRDVERNSIMLLCEVCRAGSPELVDDKERKTEFRLYKLWNNDENKAKQVEL